MTLVDLEDRLWGHPSGVLGRIGGRLMSWFDRGIVERAVSSLDLADDARVLEVGFGPGIGLTTLADRVEGGLVVGLDPSRTMHRQASRRNEAAIERGTVVLVRGDVTTLPFDDACFDAVVAVNTVHHWPDVDAGLRECRRVLVHEGRFTAAFSPHVRASSALDDARLSSHVERAGFDEPTIEHTDAGTVLTGVVRTECSPELSDDDTPHPGVHEG